MLSRDGSRQHKWERSTAGEPQRSMQPCLTSPSRSVPHQGESFKNLVEPHLARLLCRNLSLITLHEDVGVKPFSLSPAWSLREQPWRSCLYCPHPVVLSCDRHREMPN